MQVPYLTDSHQKMIKTVQDRHPRILILLGVAKDSQITERDPFTYDFRKQMLQQYLRPHDDIQGLMDCPESDEEWVKLLDHTVKIYLFPEETAILYGGRESFIPYYLGHNGLFKTQELAPAENDSGTALREIVATLPPVYSPDTACAILWYQKKLRLQFGKTILEIQEKKKLELQKVLEAPKIVDSQPFPGKKKRGKNPKN
ncbi:MAG: hypothetical protein LBD11_02975 [Candidatus Peribacteria bacterium]|nr:hypothetical protein [Candidatus Peribacteria bacterium]